MVTGICVKMVRIRLCFFLFFMFLAHAHTHFESYYSGLLFPGLFLSAVGEERANELTADRVVGEE